MLDESFVTSALVNDTQMLSGIPSVLMQMEGLGIITEVVYHEFIQDFGNEVKLIEFPP